MRQLIVLIFCLLTHATLAFPQNTGHVEGYVTDAKTGDPLPGAHVFIRDGKGTLADENGKYKLVLETGEHILHTQFIGYLPSIRDINITQNGTTTLNIELTATIEILEEVVVTAEKTEQKITDVNVSMAILKPKQFERTSPTSLEGALVQIPGVEILDGQPSIRGGSGFSYGAGSRVLVLVDDLPLLSGDAGHVQWNFLPLENLSQVEIIKGASSVLYGSSALNGVINLRYKDPGDKPVTSLRMFSGAYLAPDRKELIWWDSPRWFAGNSVSHARKIGNLDLTTGAYLFQDKGYRDNEFNKQARVNINLKYRSKTVSGLSYGLSTSGMLVNQGDFFLWENADSGAYRQNPTGTSFSNGHRIYVDPSIRYFTSKGNKHSINSRYYRSVNQMPENEDKNSRFYLVLGEYRYQHRFSDNIKLILGSSFNYSKVHSKLFGQHTKNEAAVFTQLSAKIFSRLKYNLGFRWETYRLNEIQEHSHPVFRTGLNYQLFPHTFLRLSAGQGYRFPSIAEKFTATQIGALNIFPNPDLLSETAISADVGLIQGYQLGTWTGFIDLSLFRSEYINMIEFTFGVYMPEGVTIPTLDNVGFKALNVGQAQITGLEVILNTEKRIGQFNTSFQAGYTFINPIDLSIEKDSTTGNILKYRHRHSAKGDINLSWRKWSTGATVIYNSFMEQVDSVFIDRFFGNMILPGYPKYREENQKGYTTVDLRLSYDIFRKTNISIICKNLFNVEYMGRPGDLQAHRSVTLQFLLNL